MKSPDIQAIRWRIKPALHLLLVLPALVLVWAAFNNGLGVNPIEKLTHETGQWGLRILLLTLAVSPAAQLTRSGWLVQLRRMIGLYCFFYILVHFSIYLLFDLSLDFGFLIDDIIKRPYITVGFSGFVILLALAVTSPIAVRRRMAKAWIKLHRLVYAAGILGVIHLIWITRVAEIEPLIYAAVLALLLGYRLARFMRRRNPRGGYSGAEKTTQSTGS